jgi:hypothetical protein
MLPYAMNKGRRWDETFSASVPYTAIAPATDGSCFRSPREAGADLIGEKDNRPAPHLSTSVAASNKRQFSGVRQESGGECAGEGRGAGTPA